MGYVCLGPCFLSFNDVLDSGCTCLHLGEKRAALCVCWHENSKEEVTITTIISERERQKPAEQTSSRFEGLTVQFLPCGGNNSKLQLQMSASGEIKC